MDEMPASDNFYTVFEELREIIIPYANDLDLKVDSASSVYIDTNHVMKNGKPLFFGAVKINKRYVSYHLMPIYVNPDLLDGMSESLMRRMQGKSCFNFTGPNHNMYSELRELTRLGYEDYRSRGYV